MVNIPKLFNKKNLVVIIPIAVIVLIFLGYFVLVYFQTPEKELELGAEIEEVYLSEELDKIYVGLAGGSNEKEITKVKFVFTDEEGEEHSYETTSGVQEISVPFKRTFWDWFFGREVFEGEYDYEINADSAGLNNFASINSVGVVFEYKTETGEKVETETLTTEKPKPTYTSSGGPGGPSTTTCTPKTCSQLEKQCGEWDNGCNAMVDCGSCEEGTYCYLDEGISGVCIDNTITCTPSDDICSDDNLVEYYCYWNGTDFEIKNTTSACEYGCEAGACLGEPCSTNEECDDGLYCNGVETCGIENRCQAGTEVDCSDGVDCTADNCIEETDSYSCENIPNDNLCSDTECDIDNDGCVGNDYYDYNDVPNSCLSSGCEDNPCDDYSVSYSDARCISEDCEVSSSLWQNFDMTSQAGTFSITFEATPSDDYIDGITAFSEDAQASFFDFAILIRFFYDGYIDAFDNSRGDYFAETSIPYIGGQTYSFRIEVDVPNQKYDAYVDDVLLADDYAFRVSMSAIDNWGIIEDTGVGTHTVCNLEVITACTSDTQCSHLDDDCNIGKCNLGTGNCYAEASNEGGACDTLYCKTGQTCASGVCQGGSDRDCSETPVDIGCTDDECNEVTDSCYNIPNNANCGTNERCEPSNQDADPVTGCVEIDPCTNRIKDPGEEGVDCGGSCPLDCCQNDYWDVDLGEEGVDCGGSCVACPEGTSWFIDNTASGNNDGTSWTDAWQSFSAINWASVQPGDTVYISGGPSGGEKYYYETLSINKAGTSSHRVTIKVGQDNAHNGKVVIDGQMSNTYGILVRGVSKYVTVDGNVNGEQHIKVQNNADQGLQTPGNHIEIAYLELCHNGNGDSIDSGIKISGIKDYGNSIHHCKVHHNVGQQLRYPDHDETATHFGWLDIHDNEVYGVVNDGVVVGGNGVRIYNNKIWGRHEDYSTGHPDGMQTMNTKYLAIYNNTFYDMTPIDPAGSVNSLIRVGVSQTVGMPPEAYQAHNLYIYNNVFYETVPPLAGRWCRALEFSLTDYTTSGSDILIAHNTFVDIPFYSLMVNLNGLDRQHINNVMVANNILYNSNTLREGSNRLAIMIGSADDRNAAWTSGSFGDGDADVIVDHNIMGVPNNDQIMYIYKDSWLTLDQLRTQSGCQDHGGEGDPDFVYYSERSTDNDFHLKATDTLAKDQGADLSEYNTIFEERFNPHLEEIGFAPMMPLNVDRDGNRRDLDIGWDIGAYEYTEGVGMSGTPTLSFWQRIKQLLGFVTFDTITGNSILGNVGNSTT